MVQPTVAAGVISGLLDFAESRGADPVLLVAQAHIDAEALDNPDGRIPLHCYRNLMRRAQSMTGDPALALHFSEEVDMASVSILGLIMEASPTMGDAFAQLQRYGRLAADVEHLSDGPRFELAQRAGKLFLVDRRNGPNEFPELTERTFASLACGPRRFLPRPHVLAVFVTHPAPGHAEEYERIFRCPVHFSAEWNALELHPQIAGWEVAQTPRYVFGILTRHADGLLEDMQAEKGLRSRVETLLLPILHQGDVSADMIAEKLGFSRQTLFRKLKGEDTTFSEVLDDLRQRTAKLYLEGQTASVNETAYLVGFSEPSSFSRAFKRWTGHSPKEFRREVRDGLTKTF